MFSCQHVTDRCTLAGSADFPLFICRDLSAPPLLGGEHDIRSIGFRLLCADNFGVLARGANCSNVHLARLIAGVPADVQMFSVMKCHQPTRIAAERANGSHEFVQSLGRSVRAVASAVRRWGSSVVASLSRRSAVVVLSQSLTPAPVSLGPPI